MRSLQAKMRSLQAKMPTPHNKLYHFDIISRLTYSLTAYKTNTLNIGIKIALYRIKIKKKISVKQRSNYVAIL